MKILIAGAGGMLGTDLVAALRPGNEIKALTRNELDITGEDHCREQVLRFRPDYVLCAAAMTDVDGCEKDAERAFAANASGAGNLAAAAALAGAVIVHYSTDYIFDGRKKGPYVEEDTPNPLSVYGKSKHQGEELVRTLCREHLILRTSWVFGKNGRNFLRTIAGSARREAVLRVVDDQRGSPTYTRDLAKYTRTMVEAGCRGTYHITNSGSCTWFELAERVVSWLGLAKVSIIPVTTAEFPRPAPRPVNSELANARLEREGFPSMRPWREAAQEYVTTELRIDV